MSDPPSRRNTLCDRARRDDPAAVVAAADLAAWEQAEGLASDAAAAAIQRKDFERFIPGLPARRTFMVLGWVTLAAFVLDSALEWVPSADWVDMADAVIRYGTACCGIAVAGWSILSEVRGWEGSDASTWFMKARVDRTQKKLALRRAALGDTVIALGASTLAIYREQGGSVVVETYEADAVVGLLLEHAGDHMALRLTTRVAAVLRFEWLPQDTSFEAAVRRFRETCEATNVVTTSL